MARILIESIPVIFGYDHLYLVIEYDNGEKFVIRGGPESDPELKNGNSVNAFQGSIVIKEHVTLLASGDDRGDETPTDRGSREIDLQGRNAEDVWNIMRHHARNIDSANLNYNAFFDAQNLSDPLVL